MENNETNVIVPDYVSENKLTEEQIDKIQETLEETRESSPQLTEVFDAMNSDPPVEQGEMRLVNVNIDTATGKEQLVSGEEVNPDDISTDFADLIDSDLNIDIENGPISIEELKEYIKKNKDGSLLEGGDVPENVTDEDLLVVLDLITKIQNKEELSSPFNKLPESFQKLITNAMGPGYENVYTNEVNSLKNDMAEMLLDQFLTSIVLDRASYTITSGMEKIYSKATGEIGDTIIGYTEDRNKEYREEIEKIEDPEKKEKAIKLLDIIDNAYLLTELKEYCKKCKIKKFDVENPLVMKNHDIDYIMSKYENTSKFNIYNIYNAQAALDRNLNTEDAEVTYSAKQLRAFLVAFSKYCMNFDPNNTEQHAFMFYTIYNIILTDINKGEKAEISKKFLDNVKECIGNLIQRNPFLAD